MRRSKTGQLRILMSTMNLAANLAATTMCMHTNTTIMIISMGMITTTVPMTNHCC